MGGGRVNELTLANKHLLFILLSNVWVGAGTDLTARL